LINRVWLGSSDKKNDSRSCSQGSANQKLARATHSFQKLPRLQDVLTALRTNRQMIFDEIALRGCESAIQIGRNLDVCQVIAPFVRWRAHSVYFPVPVG
jgi:hypothetical protein